VKKTFVTISFILCVFLICLNSFVRAHTDITPEEAKNMIETNDDLIVVDVREGSEYCDENPSPYLPPGHISGALNYPWTSGVLEEQYGELHLDGEILVVCRSGHRSNEAANFLDSKGFQHIYDMEGGMLAWEWDTVDCSDYEGDGVNDDLDNCPEIPNGSALGTCVAGNIGSTCESQGDCGIGGFCSMDQEDADEDGEGDVCDDVNPFVSLFLKPEETVVPRGGSLELQATIINNTNKSGTVYFATKVKLLMERCTHPLVISLARIK